MALDSADVAVLVPCYNEEMSIGGVVADFRRHLPAARIYVYDNNSTDGTARVAREAGALVRVERRQGKGHVIRRMFSDVEAHIYVLVDGDGTYDAGASVAMIGALIDDDLDMVTGRRVTSIAAAYRPGHRAGNRILTGIVGAVFGRQTQDMLSGYRVFSRRFVKSFPALSRGFEIETELTVHALELRMAIADVDALYIDRLPGSASKLRTIRDGMRILVTIGALMKEERPMQVFGIASLALALASLALAAPVVATYLETGLVPRLPTAILSAGMMGIAILSFFVGLILDSVTHGRREMKRLAYVAEDSVRVAEDRRRAAAGDLVLP